LQKIWDYVGLEWKSFENSPRCTYQRYVYAIANSRKQAKILHRFLPCQLDYILLRGGDEQRMRLVRKLL
jgi:hypothetical protein